MDQFLAIEVKQLPLAKSNVSKFHEIISRGLKALAYSIRGNKDVSFRVILLIHGGALEGLTLSERDNLFVDIQEMARPYWQEFTWCESDAPKKEHPGFKYFQIWIESGPRKATPTFFLSRFWVWGEDGTKEKTWGEIEYATVAERYVENSSAGREFIKLTHPYRHIYREIPIWEGYPHLARNEAGNAGEVHATPPFMAEPFFKGFITPYEGKPFLTWAEVIADSSGKYKELRRYYIDDFLPCSPGNPKVIMHVSSDEDTYMAPGGALYLFKVVQKQNKDEKQTQAVYAYQPKTQDKSLWRAHSASARHGFGVKSNGKCLVWGTIDSDTAIGPKPGFPFGIHYTLLWLYSGIVPARLEQLIDHGKLRPEMSTIEQQKVVSGLFQNLLLTADEVSDEIYPVKPSRALKLWGILGRTGKRNGIWAKLQRMQCKELAGNAWATYKDTLLHQLMILERLPVLDRSVAVIERPDGKPDVNFVHNVIRDFGGE